MFFSNSQNVHQIIFDGLQTSPKTRIALTLISEIGYVMTTSSCAAWRHFKWAQFIHENLVFFLVFFFAQKAIDFVHGFSTRYFAIKLS